MKNPFQSGQACGSRRLACLALLLLSPIAATWGQVAPQAGAADSIDEIVVTGSRISRTGFDAPTPTTVMDSTQINLAAAPNIGQLVTEMPMFEATNTPAATTVSSQFAGQNNLNLRGLGAVETLVLVDGRRFVPSTALGLVDTNVIPSSLVDRLEVVTGGASAAWGSDAVAGVVNIITKKNIEGFSGDFQPGISQYSDNKTFKGSLMWGTGFGDGNGHFVIAAEGDKESGVGQQTARPWASQGYNVVGNPNAGTPGQPAYLIAPNVQMSQATLGGLITSGPLMAPPSAPAARRISSTTNPAMASINWAATASAAATTKRSSFPFAAIRSTPRPITISTASMCSMRRRMPFRTPIIPTWSRRSTSEHSDQQQQCLSGHQVPHACLAADGRGTELLPAGAIQHRFRLHQYR